MRTIGNDTQMRNAMIRVSAKNTVTKDYPKLGLKAGDVYEVSFSGIIDTLIEWAKTKKLEYFAIEHYSDQNNIHYHAVIVFDENSQAKFSQIKERFPFGEIERCNHGVANCVKYLVHLLNPEKHQYDFEDVVTNAPASLEKYKTIGSINERTLLAKLCGMIIDGDIKEYEINRIPPVIYTKHRRKIENAFDYRRKLLLNNTDRNVMVIYIQGPSGAGKTTFCKAYAKKNDMSIKFSSSGRHPLEGYGGEDILVLDDIEIGEISIYEMLNALDPNNNYEIAVRYKRILFTGEMIFICSNHFLGDWYRDEDENVLKAFYRRIKYVFEFSNKDNNNVVRYSINTIRIKTREEKERERKNYIDQRFEEEPFDESDWDRERRFREQYSKITLDKIDEKTFNLNPYINSSEEHNEEKFLSGLNEL